jgi:hypothetical protein
MQGSKKQDKILTITGSGKGEQDKDNNNCKQSTRTLPTPKSNKQQNKVEERTQASAKVRAVLIKTEGQLVRAEQQVGINSKTSATDRFLEGQVYTWTKETLWKMCKIIMNHQEMHKVMH